MSAIWGGKACIEQIREVVDSNDHKELGSILHSLGLSGDLNVFVAGFVAARSGVDLDAPLREIELEDWADALSYC